MNLLTASVLSLLILLGSVPVTARATVIDFESLSDLTSVTNQFFGLTFSNTTALTAGISLNEFEFPPRSGTNVVFDDGGAMVITFSSPQSSVGGYLTYLSLVTFSAFDSSLNPVGSDTSNFGSNLGLSGDAGSSPNEFFGVTSLAGISRVIIQGDPSGGSFTLDDLTFDAAAAVPEPSSLSLITAGLISLLGVTRIRKTCDHSHNK